MLGKEKRSLRSTFFFPTHHYFPVGIALRTSLRYQKKYKEGGGGAGERGWGRATPGLLRGGSTASSGRTASSGCTASPGRAAASGRTAASSLVPGSLSAPPFPAKPFDFPAPLLRIAPLPSTASSGRTAALCWEAPPERRSTGDEPLTSEPFGWRDRRSGEVSTAAPDTSGGRAAASKRGVAVLRALRGAEKKKRKTLCVFLFFF